MAEFNIKTKTGAARMTIHAADNSNHTTGIQEDSVLSLSMVTQECVRLEPGDYVLFLGFQFWLLEAYTPKQINNVEWTYDLKFFGVESIIKQALMLSSEGVPLEAYHAPAHEQLEMVVMNLNRWMGNITDWKVGAVVATENLDIDYSGGTYCNEALKKISEAAGAGVEWWMEGMTVNITKAGHTAYGDAVVGIKLGYGNGLLSIERDNADNVPFFTRLFPIGSSRNIEYGSYGHKRLQLPGGAKYVERNTDKYGVVERYEEEAFAHIFPRRTGYVSAVRTETAKNDDGTEYTIYYFTDQSLTFNPNNYEIGGLVKHIIFQSGDVAGRDFEVNWNNTTKEFEIITTWPYNGDIQVPGGLLVPKPGNSYVLYNLRMPDEYYPMAEQEFRTAIDNFLTDHSGMTDRSVFKCTTNYIDLDSRDITLTVGQRVRLFSDRFFPGIGYRDSRITRISRNVNRPNQADIEISDVLSQTSQSSMQDSIAEVSHEIKTATTTFPVIIRSWDGTLPTDNNLFSARRVLREALSKKNDDTAAGLIKFIQGIEIGDFTTGFLGGGGAFKMVDGISELEVDKLTVRMMATFFELVISKLSHIGGQLVLSPARMKCTRVEDDGNGYKCYFERGENNEVNNEFVVGDQARCQVFTGSGVKMYWRLVSSVGDDWINLSKTDCVPGSSAPVAGDDIVQLGNRTDKNRQSAQILSTVGNDAPSYKQYAGINSYSLEGKELTVFSSKGNKISGATTFTSNSGKEQSLANWVDEQEQKNDELAQKRFTRAEKWATPGYEFYREGQAYNATLALRIYYDNEDVTATVDIARFKWYRVSENPEGDVVWNSLHAGAGASVEITGVDLVGDTSFIVQFYDGDAGGYGEYVF